MKKERGFTLIEIMVVVAIIGILVAIAFPSYQKQLKKGRRAAAQTFLMNASNAEQQYLLDARTYSLGATTAVLTSLNLYPPPTEVSNFYTIAVTPAAATTPPSFVITATPIVGSQQDGDGALSIDNTGQKTFNGSSGW